MTSNHVTDLAANMAPLVTRNEFVAILDLLPMERQKLEALMPHLVGRMYGDMPITKVIPMMLDQFVSDYQLGPSAEVSERVSVCCQVCDCGGIMLVVFLNAFVTHTNQVTAATGASG